MEDWLNTQGNVKIIAFGPFSTPNPIRTALELNPAQFIVVANSWYVGVVF
jgi:hypothetical protein